MKKNKLDIHRLCIVCLKAMDYNKYSSKEDGPNAWNIKFYNNENYNEVEFSRITMAVHKNCFI